MCNDELFDAIHTAHLSTGHGARDITHNKTSASYVNVTKEIIQLYVNRTNLELTSALVTPRFDRANLGLTDVAVVKPRIGKCVGQS